MATAQASLACAAAASRSVSVSLRAYSSLFRSRTLRRAAFSGVVRNRPRPAAAAAAAQPPSASHGAATRLYVRGLSFRTTEESLRNAFGKFGQLVEVDLVMDRAARRPRGFAFVSYADEEEAKNAMAEMHGKFLDGRVIFVEAARRRPGL
ncbi:hypothetical protein ACP4OV_026504 [Aristida adscensionis]